MDISQIVYLVLVVLSAPLLFVVAYFLYKKTQKTKSVLSRNLAKSFFIFGIGDILLILEQFVLNLHYFGQTTITDRGIYEETARILVCTAIFMVAFGLWYLNAFSLGFLPEKYEKFIYIIGPLAFIHAVLYFLFPYNWSFDGTIWEFAHNVEPWHTPVLIVFYLTPVWLSPIILLFATYKIRHEQKIVLTRSITIAIGLIIGAFGYSVQVVAPSILSGLSFFLMPLIVYIGFIMPNWYKKLTGVSN